MSFILTPTSSDILTTTFSVSTDDYVSSPITTSANLTYSKPLIGSYQSLNFDPEVRNKLIKYYFYKILDKWLYNDLKSVLDNVKNGNIEEKIKHIENNVLTKKIIKKILKKFVEKTHINWVDLPHKESDLKKIFKYELNKLLSKKQSGGDKKFLPLYNSPMFANPYKTPFVPQQVSPSVVAVSSPVINLVSPSNPLFRSPYDAFVPKPIILYPPQITLSPGRRVLTLGSLSLPLRNVIYSVYPGAQSYPLDGSLLVLLYRVAQSKNMKLMELIDYLKTIPKKP
jgi:hypothetical protein